MFRILITISICCAAFASCSKDEAAGRNSELDGFKVGTSNPQSAAVAIARPDWLLAAPPCPADSLPKDFQESDYDLDACAGSAVTRCLKECEVGQAPSCYASAIVLQRSQIPTEQNMATALFSKACQLGDASGCTNWAATLVDEGDPGCIRRSFEAACIRGHDPWGCTMYARALMSQSDGHVEIATVQALVADACRLGEDDPACEAIRTIIQSLAAPGNRFQVIH